ncbi:hypothetical protein N7478_006847 [Penicillium angulare]|uniref:uncharacterized protein n=1 Tax=Penicillium angulare TaxID=116970 RepID=UPI002542331F|nr:uncharacterized protein N7478_006847 [Penicillium angulare]KAJ5281475.1 hypothetical protein N7478_006847 [Penicillium angulare]
MSGSNVVHIDKLSLHDTTALNDNEQSLHLSDLESIYKLGMSHHENGNIKAAEDLLFRAAEGYEKACGLQDTKTLDALEYLGITYRKLVKLQEAEVTHTRVVEARTLLAGPEHQTTLVAWNRLAMVYRAQGRLDEAESVYQRVWKTLDKTLGPDDEATLRAAVSLGNLAYGRRKYIEAAEIYTSTLGHYEIVLGADHSSTQQVASNLAAVFIQQGKHPEAELILVALVNKIRESQGSNSVRLLPPLLNLSYAYGGQEKHDEALKVLASVLDSYEGVYGRNHPKTLGIMKRRADALAKQAHLTEAIEMIQKGISLSSDSEESKTQLMISLANIFIQQSKFSEAREIYRQLSEESEKSFGKDHDSTIRHLISEAEVLFMQREFLEAESIFKYATERYTKTIGAEAEQTLWSLMGQCHAACGAGKISEVESSIWLLFETCEVHKSLRNGRAILVFQDLSKHCVQNKKFKEADALMTKGYEICQKLFDRGHPVTIFYGLKADKVRRQQRRHQQGLPVDIAVVPQGGDQTPDSLIDMFEFVVSLTTKPNDPSAPLPSGLIANLAMSYGEKWVESKDIFYLNNAIDKLETAILVGKEDEPDRSKWLDRLGKYYKARFQATNGLDDLRKSIDATQAAIDLQKQANEVSPDDLSYLAESLIDLHERDSTMEPLNKAIELGQTVISSTDLNDVDRAKYLGRLGMAFMLRYEMSGIIEDLNNSFDFIGEAMSMTPKSESRWKRLCASYADLLRHRFKHNGEIQDLEEAVNSIATAINAGSEEDPSLLESLARQLGYRYDALGKMEDLDKSIVAAERAVELWDKSSKYLADGLMRLGYLLMDRFEATGHQEDLDRSIVYLAEASKTPKTNSTAEARCLSGLANAFWLRWMRTRASDDLEEAINKERLALEVVSDSDLGKVDVMNNLANILIDRFKETKDLSDIEEAIQFIEKVLSSRPSTHMHYPGNLNNLANAIEARYKEQANIVDLNMAIEKSEEALSLMREDHPSRAGYSFNLGARYYARYQKEDNSQDMQNAIDRFLEGWKAPSGRPFDRVLAGSQAIYKLRDTGRLEEATTIAMEVVDLLPQVTTRSLNVTDQQYVVREFSGIAGNACSLLLSLGRLNDALEYLEKGRTVILDLLMSNRMNLGDLEAISPEYAAKFRQLQDQINKTFDSARIDSVGAETLLQKRLSSVSQFNECVEEIRKLPGQSRFLLGPELNEIRAGAKNGCIVIMNITNLRSDAIIISPEKIDSIELPNLSRQRGLEWLNKDLTRKAKNAAERKRKNAEYRDLLHWLWTSGVKPIFDRIGLKPQSLTQKLPRVCWIASGIASMLPFHAACDQTASDTENTFEYAISSYSPSIKTMFQVRAKLSNDAKVAQPSLLMVGMPTTKGHASLPGVEDEIDDIQEAVEDSFSIKSLIQPQPGRVLSDLSSHDIVHFACHAVSDSRNPLNGHLLLQAEESELPGTAERGALTVESIMKMDLKRARIAYLSACSTAENKATKLLDEAIHLVSGFQVAGFAHVLGTMWPAPDLVSHSVAVGFYENLTSLLSPASAADDGRAVAEAFHSSVKEVRSDFEEQPLRWAQFVHFGG